MKDKTGKSTLGGSVSGSSMSAGVSDGLSSQSSFDPEKQGPTYSEKTDRPKPYSSTSVSKGGIKFDIV